MHLPDLVSGHTSSPSPRRASHSWALLTHLPFNASSSGMMLPLASCLLRTQQTGGVDLKISLGSRLPVYRDLKFQMTGGGDPSSFPHHARLPGSRHAPRTSSLGLPPAAAPGTAGAPAAPQESSGPCDDRPHFEGIHGP